jgi:rhodanese-related sulfurtransferase
MTTTSSPLLTHLSPDEFIQLPHPHRLIDVRSHMEYRMFHAPTAINLSLPRILLGRLPGLRWMLPDWFRSLPKHEAIAVVCLTSHRSPIAAEQLIKDGFQNVINISGGMMEWQKSELPTRSGRPS